MTAPDDDTRAPLTLEEVAQEVLELTAERTLEGLATRFVECLRRWAAPSAILAAVRDPAAESGWRLLPALCAGSGPLGAERSVRQLIEELPEDLARPSLVRPAREIPGVRVRENCLVPWSCEGESGVLMLRGVAHPSAPNLADAVALLAAPAWPRMLGGPASRVESGVAELRRLAERLRDDADRQLERLAAARPSAVEEPPAEDRLLATRLAEVEQQRTSARDEAARLSSIVESLRSESEGVAARLEEERRAAEEARAAARAAEEALATARKELTGAAQSAARAGLEREELRVQVITLEKALAEADDERNAARGGTPGAPAASPGGEALRGVLAVLRRTPFAPAPLRVAAREAEASVGAEADRPAAWARVALLDRDTGGLESLADGLEEAGVDVKLASHPEELTLLLKTPEGRELDAMICDVLAFRPDQNVAGLFRSWEKDRPGLAFYLSLGRDSQPEVERAQRVPQSLTRGRFQRPLNRTELIGVLEPLRRRAP